jgi:SAM-dependent methyltransferase
MCFTMLRCPECDVVYACESPSPSTIGHAYLAAAYDSKMEAIDAADTYERALRPYLSSMSDRRGALEIGAGTGAFLQRLRGHGFTGVVGVEPSRLAVDAADADIKPCIREEMFCADHFEAGSMSFIGCFMTLEHVAEPAALIRECFPLLRAGGLIACVVHDWRAWNNRVLGRRSAIIDIEHLQLFSKASVRELYRRSGFVDIECRSFWNRYRVDYWNRLLPTPSFLKRGLEIALRRTRVGRLRVPMKVGNLMAVARKAGH